MINFKDFFQLQLKESVLIHVRVAQSNLTFLIVDGHVSLKFKRSTLINVTIKAIMRLWRSILARNMCAVLNASDSLIMHRSLCDSLSHQLLYHLTKLFVVSEQLCQLILVYATATCLVDVTAEACHFILHLSLHLGESRVLQHVECFLQLLIIFFELVEIGWLVGVTLQKSDDIVVNGLQLVFSDTLVSQSWVCLI